MSENDDVDRWIVLLKHRNWHERDKAVKALERIGEPAIEVLTHVLQDQDLDVRMRAVKTLGNIGDVKAVPPLIQALQDRSYPVQAAVARALGKLKDGRAIGPLLLTLKESTNQKVRSSATEALGAIGDQRVVPTLIQLLKDSAYSMRFIAAKALGMLKDVRAVESLIDVLQDNATDVRKEAARTLGQIKDPRAVIPLISVLQDREKWVRCVAITALGKLRDVRAIDALSHSLKDADNFVQIDAIEALGKIQDIRVVETLGQVLQDSDDYARIKAAEALGTLGDPRAIPFLLQKLQDTNWGVRQQTAMSLDQLRWIPKDEVEQAQYFIIKKEWHKLERFGAVTIAILVPELQNILIRENIALVLNKIGWQPKNTTEKVRYFIARGDWDEVISVGAKAVPFLIQELTNEWNSWSKKASATEALGKLGDPRAINPLIQMLIDYDDPDSSYEDWEVHRIAQSALGEIDWKLGNISQQILYLVALEKWKEILQLGEAVIIPLKQALQMDSCYIRRRVVKALGKLGNRNMIDLLLQELQGTDFCILRAVVKALGELGDLRAVVPLLRVMWEDEVHLDDVVVEAIKAMGESTIPLLLQTLQNSDELIRKSAAYILDQQNWQTKDVIEKIHFLFAVDMPNEVVELGESAVIPLIQQLQEGVVHVRMYAAEALGKLGDPRAVEPLIQALRDDTDEIRKITAEVLGALGDARAVEPLVQTLREDIWYVYEAAVKALVIIGEPAVNPLFQALQDEHWWVRETATQALGNIGDLRACKPLTQVLNDPDPRVQKAVQTALARLQAQHDEE